MKVQIAILSTDMVKPSSPTLQNLQSYRLSSLDQLQPDMFMPLVLFYPPADDDLISSAERSNQLKKSLSQALTSFYPLAGRLVGNSYINCNDEGVPYLEAKANCKLSEVLNDPVPGEMNKFLPYEMVDSKSLGMAIQVNFFECGGMAVGIEMSHKVADAISMSIFLTSWAAVSRGETNVPSPIFESATLFPARDISGYNPGTRMLIKQKDNITKRFVFTASKISELRANYANDDENSRRPTRIEALSALICNRFIAATQSKDDPNKICVLSHTVNLRTRTDPPLLGHYFGNLYESAISLLSLGGNNDESYNIVNKLRETISNIGVDYVTNIREGTHLNLRKEASGKIRTGEAVGLAFTSLCRLPFYEADFGWGKPAWVSSVSFNFKNLVSFLDAQSGDGIEAWVSLEVEDMAKFETDEEILYFVSSN